MRVVARGNRGADLSRQALETSGNTETSIFHVTLGHEYVVYALAWWRSGVGLLVLTDLGRLGWVHGDLFDVVDGRISARWTFASAPGPEYVLALCGHEALVADAEHHDRLVYGQRDAVRTFLAQRDRTHETSADSARIRDLELTLEK